jgi:hypothetical protein
MNNLNNSNIEWTDEEFLELKRKTMRRVYMVWFLRKILVPAFVVLPLMGFLLFRQISLLTMTNILETTLLKLSEFNLIGLINYVVVAVRFAEIDALLILTSSLLLLAFFGRRLIRDLYLFWLREPALNINERRI